MGKCWHASLQRYVLLNSGSLGKGSAWESHKVNTSLRGKGALAQGVQSSITTEGEAPHVAQQTPPHLAAAPQRFQTPVGTV